MGCEVIDLKLVRRALFYELQAERMEMETDAEACRLVARRFRRDSRRMAGGVGPFFTHAAAPADQGGLTRTGS